MPNDGGLEAIAHHALGLIPPQSVVGLGTGRAATVFIHALGERVRNGFPVRAIPTSQASAALATQLGIPLTRFEDVEDIDVCVDGADEVDPAGNLIKGFGGALLREKVVAASARRLVILVGPEKLVPVLGTRGLLPVEVVPFALTPVERRLRAMGLNPQLRRQNGQTFITDNGHHILDCRIGPLDDPRLLDDALHRIPGVVETGLFLDFALCILIPEGDRVSTRITRPSARPE
ncbi:MAG: ribose-5-phosphate isomerase RpiA [Gemmataceae bacterium]|nr:ribose-5-phosphate isomerase RpiA [Gemmata sp.]MDW8195964.1 ribose-5-phosphate isomerase RpiA [Gemmataceae bacterium]